MNKNYTFTKTFSRELIQLQSMLTNVNLDFGPKYVLPNLSKMNLTFDLIDLVSMTDINFDPSLKQKMIYAND